MYYVRPTNQVAVSDLLKMGFIRWPFTFMRIFHSLIHMTVSVTRAAAYQVYRHKIVFSENNACCCCFGYFLCFKKNILSTEIILGLQCITRKEKRQR